MRPGVVCGLCLLAAAARGQDTRHVVEPAIPRSCTVLTARLSAVDGNRTISAADESRADTARIQQAIDGCRAGQAVELRADGGRNAFLTGPLDLRNGVALHIAARTILFGSRNPRDYDVRPNSCGIVALKGHGCRALINGDHVAHAAVVGDGVIDGRGWAKLLGQNVSWWDLAEQARAGGTQNCPRLLVLSHADDFTLYRVTLKNAGQFHVVYGAGSGFTAWGVIIDTPKTARNTDGIDPSGSTNVTIAHCFISTGDDNIAIKAGTHAANMTIAHNHFYAGHGMSIGSETNGGAEAIRVTDLSIDGADNGIRIKSNSSRGGPVRDVVYSDVCIRNTRYPILLDSDYAHYGRGGERIPSYTGIVLRDVRVSGGGRIGLQGYDEQHRLGVTFDNVYFDAPQDLKILAGHAQLSFGPGNVNFRPTGPDVVIQGAPVTGQPNACGGKFVPLPVR